MPDQRMTGLFGLSPSTADVRDILSTIPVRKGGVLPLTEYGDGTSRLDWTAGIPGSLWDAFTAPARAYRGEIPEDQMIPEGLNFAGSVALGSAAVPRPRGSVGMGSLKEGASHLDMSPEARMARAREMGFNTSDTYYHGTHSDFDQFDTSGIGVLGRGTYFTRNAPGTASVWARGEDGSVIPAYIRGNYPDISEAGALYRYMPGFIQKRMAESRGHDGYTTGGGAIVAVHDPSNIRSVNAAFDPAKSSSANLLAANPETGAAPGLGLMAAAKQEPKGFIAYHGSPHDFDRFDISKIGTGEGAQAYGHGLYFADSEGVAKSYRNGLSKGIRHDPSQTGYRLNGEVPNLKDNPSHIAWKWHDEFGDQAASAMRSRMQEFPHEFGPSEGVTSKQYQDALEMLKSGAPLPTREELGKLYQVRINADPDHFLDWDKPLSQQSEAVRGALRTALADRGLGTTLADYIAGSERPGRDAISALARGQYDTRLNVPDGEMSAQASAKLRDAGIPGIKYLDQGSRSAGEGSRNYVVFDDKLIDILKKYGLFGSLGMGAASMMSGGEANAAPAPKASPLWALQPGVF